MTDKEKILGIRYKSYFSIGLDRILPRINDQTVNMITISDPHDAIHYSCLTISMPHAHLSQTIRYLPQSL